MEHITLLPVESGMLKAVGYDPAAKILEAQFKNSETRYQYHQVPPEVFADFNADESKGKFFAAEIRNHFQSSKVEQEEV